MRSPTETTRTTPGLEERIRAWLRPPRRLRPTRSGWMFLLILLGVGFAALHTANNLLYLIESLLLAFLTLSGILSESALRGIEIRRNLPREIFVGIDNPVHIEIKNTQTKVPSFAIVVEDRSAPESSDTAYSNGRLRESAHRPALGRVFALRIGPGEIVSRGYPLQPRKRGALRFHSVRVSTRFPFGLFSKSREIAAWECALVYPEIASPIASQPGSDDDAIDLAPVSSARSGSAVDGLREFEMGDSLSRVHWKSSLRRDRLLVRTQEREQSAEIEVRLRTCSREGFETRIRRATGEVVALLGSGQRVGLATDFERIPPQAGPRQRARLLSFLALVEIGDAPPDPARRTVPSEIDDGVNRR